MDGGLVALAGTFNRCVSRKRDPLSTEGARRFGGRFNPVDTSALYLSSTPTLAVAVALGLADIYGVTRFNPRLLVSVLVSLGAVLDLTSAKTRRQLGLTKADLLVDWRSDPAAAITQHIGAQAQAEGVEGILFPSRIEHKASNLCVFRENLLATSTIAVEGYDDVFPLAGEGA